MIERRKRLGGVMEMEWEGRRLRRVRILFLVCCLVLIGDSLQEQQTLAGTEEWTLMSYLPSGGTELVPVLNGTITKPGLEESHIITALFGEDGVVSGSSGCNSYSSSFTENVATGGLTISEFTVTMRQCESEGDDGDYGMDEDVMNQEWDYLAALGSAEFYLMSKNELELANGDRKPVLRYIPTSMSTLWPTIYPPSESCADVISAVISNSTKLDFGEDGEPDIWFKYEITVTISSSPHVPADMVSVDHADKGTSMVSHSIHDPESNERTFEETIERVVLPESFTSVVLAAGDSVHGFCGKTFTLDLPTAATQSAGEMNEAEEKEDIGTESETSAGTFVKSHSGAFIFMALALLVRFQC